ncbi:hypothetical protein M422DRAFT_247633 [Sphaerobolus stellatus SS14]|nr:hypothetical protein M422DRAFT_247633 [Sphaerobolus stellatus SS14]
MTGIMDAAAVTLLAKVWKANQRIEAEKWKKANEEAAVAEEERLRVFAEDDASRITQDTIDQEEALRVDKKKYPNKYSLIYMHDPPIQHPDIPWREGLDAAKTTAGQALDEGLQPVIDPITGGSTWIMASAKRDTGSFKRDEDLTWDEFAGAVPRMLLAMQHARWPTECITLMAKFWGSILSHSLRLSTDPIDERTLLFYQVQQH